MNNLFKGIWTCFSLNLIIFSFCRSNVLDENSKSNEFSTTSEGININRLINPEETDSSPKKRTTETMKDDLLEAAMDKGSEVAGILGSKSLDVASTLGQQALGQAYDSVATIAQTVFDKGYEKVTGINSTELYEQGTKAAGGIWTFLMSRGKLLAATMAKSVLDDENATMSKIDFVLTKLLQLEGEDDGT